MRPRKIALLCASVCFALACLALQFITSNPDAPLGGLLRRAIAAMPVGGHV